jgi:hypothetical protein
MVARAIKNMQVPAYWPAPLGVHALENSGVVVDVKNVMAISSIPIMLDDDIFIELVELAMDIPDIAAVGVPDMDIYMLFISIAAVVWYFGRWGCFEGVFAIRRLNKRRRKREIKCQSI